MINIVTSSLYIPINDKDSLLISSFSVDNNFIPNKDKIELFLYDEQNNIIYTNYNYVDYTLDNNNDYINNIYIDFQSLLDSANIYEGKIKSNIHFIGYELSSSLESNYYIDEISSDRTEIKLKSVDINIENIDYSNNLDEFYLNFGNNIYVLGINLIKNNNEIYIKLYESLNSNIDIKSKCYIISKKADSYELSIDITGEYEPSYYTKLRGPNLALNIDKGISSTLYKNKYQILSTSLTNSYYQLSNLIKTKDLGIDLFIDYFDYSNFIKFSSAYQRLLNFRNKVSSIESYRNEIDALNNITGSFSQSVGISSSLAILNNNIYDIVSNFDNYEYYLYYDSSSYSWPKINTEPPYELYSTGSVNVLSWLGNIEPLSPYYGGMLLSASEYDNSNKDLLVNTLPEYILSDENNNNYLLYVNMMGHFFDDLWIYIKFITDKLRSDNRLNYGVHKNLINEVLYSFGLETYNDNKLDNIYYSLIGLDTSGSVLFPTGSDYITSNIDVNSDFNIPFNFEDINKEIYKRLYHNLILLLKKKGTPQNIRELLNIYGIPSTVLRINEFGQRNTNPDNDYYQNIFNYAYTVHNYPDNFSLSGIRIPWASPSSLSTRPQAISIRFKPQRIDSNSNYSQSLLYLGQGGGEPATKKLYVCLEYTGSFQSGSYSGSISKYDDWGYVKLVTSGSSGFTSASLFAPIYNGNWWTLLLNKDSNGLYIHLGSKYDNLINNNIYYQVSSSIINNTESWNNPGTISDRAVMRLGVQFSGSDKDYKGYIGSYQELRYYNNILDMNSFNSLILNPLSLESGYLNGYNNISFRAPLGGDLIYTDNELRKLSLTYTLGTYDPISMHPSTTGSVPTASFIVNNLIPSGNRYLLPETSSFNNSWSFEPNEELIYLKEPIAGLHNRINNKVQIENTLIPSGNVLTYYKSTQYNNNYYKKDANILEVVFSPQDEINDDISQQLGNFNLGDFINYSDLYSSSYNEINYLKLNYFKKYIKHYNINDYFRLSKFYNVSIFKLLDKFVPLNTNLDSGLLIKSHLLERNKFPSVLPQVENNYNYFTSSIEMSTITGSYGTELNNILINAIVVEGAGIQNTNGLYLPEYINTNGYYNYYQLNNINISNNYNKIVENGDWLIQNIDGDQYLASVGINTFPWQNQWDLADGTYPIPIVRQATLYDLQQWYMYNSNTLGLVSEVHKTLEEYINGEFTGSHNTFLTQSLISNQNILSYPDDEIYYRIYQFNTSGSGYSNYFNPLTAPADGEIYLLYDNGVIEVENPR